MSDHGPYDTEKAALEASMWHRAGRKTGRMYASNYCDLTAALDGTGVLPGAHDQRIVEWIAGYEPSTVAVIAGLIVRAHQTAAGATLGAGDLSTILSALDTAAGHNRDLIDDCADCPARTDGTRCATCDWRMQRITAYRELADRVRRMP